MVSTDFSCGSRAELEVLGQQELDVVVLEFSNHSMDFQRHAVFVLQIRIHSTAVVISVWSADLAEPSDSFGLAMPLVVLMNMKP